MVKASYLGGIGFGRFVPDSGSSSVRYHVDLHGELALKQLRLSVLNETHTTSYTGPRLIYYIIDYTSIYRVSLLFNWRHNN